MVRIFRPCWSGFTLYFLLAVALLCKSGLSIADAEIGSTLKPDLRLLIDISGSMKNSDPDNLRAPAFELMVRLLPEGAKAGVWLFGEDVQLLVPHRVVDSKWKEQALAAISQIDNSGQRTNIPAALAAATYDFDRLDSGYRTSIVLLTDGKVDVAASPMVNASEAKKVLGVLAPQLGGTGIPVHTIALSQEADWAFLRSLARVTGGIAEQAISASALSTIFIQALEMVAPTARVPVSDRQFSIDESVKEFTALVFFEGQTTGPVGLVSPDGRVFRPESSGVNAEWFQTAQFILVTMKSPQAGNWRLEASGKSRLRVSVISDLQLEVDPLPNSIAVGRRAELGVILKEQGRVVSDPALLELFEISVLITDPTGTASVIDVSGSYAVPANGEYRVLVPSFELPGRYEVLVRVQAQTLQRELPLFVEVSSTPQQATLVTRGQAPLADDFTAPLIVVGSASAAMLLIVWLILRRRKQRKLALWQRRARQIGTVVSETAPLVGVSATPDSPPSSQRLD